MALRFTLKEVTSVIGKMESGKSPGNYRFGVEHLRCTGVHLPRVLAYVFLFVHDSLLMQN